PSARTPASSSAPVRAASVPPATVGPTSTDPNVKDALLAEIRKSKVVFYNTVVAQAQKIEVTPERVTFWFGAPQRTLRDMFEQNRAWLETIAQQVAGRKMTVTSVQQDSGSAAATETTPQMAADPKSELRAQALADAGVQAMLEVFPAEIR